MLKLRHPPDSVLPSSGTPSKPPSPNPPSKLLQLLCLALLCLALTYGGSQRNLAASCASAAALLEVENEALRAEVERAFAPGAAADPELSQRHDLLLARSPVLQTEIGGLAGSLMEATFGDGPLVVEMLLQVAPGKPDLVEFELAVEEMPYTTLYFAWQVRLGLWDGCKLHRNAPHVLQFGPKAGKMEAFKESGLQQVAFQE